MWYVSQQQIASRIYQFVHLWWHSDCHWFSHSFWIVAMHICAWLFHIYAHNVCCCDSLAMPSSHSQTDRHTHTHTHIVWLMQYFISISLKIQPHVKHAAFHHSQSHMSYYGQEARKRWLFVSQSASERLSEIVLMKVALHMHTHTFSLYSENECRTHTNRTSTWY